MKVVVNTVRVRTLATVNTSKNPLMSSPSCTPIVLTSHFAVNPASYLLGSMPDLIRGAMNHHVLTISIEVITIAETRFRIANNVVGDVRRLPI